MNVNVAEFFRGRGEAIVIEDSGKGDFLVLITNGDFKTGYCLGEIDETLKDKFKGLGIELADDIIDSEEAEIASIALNLYSSLRSL